MFTVAMYGVIVPRPCSNTLWYFSSKKASRPLGVPSSAVTRPISLQSSGKHSRDQCKFKEATCHKCKKVGHISPMCWSKPKASNKQSNQWLCADSTSSTDEPLYCITDHSSCPAYQVELKVNDHPLAMEIDTGAGVSIASEAKIANLLPKLKLECTHT